MKQAIKRGAFVVLEGIDRTGKTTQGEKKNKKKGKEKKRGKRCS
jgi:thymidylate kinase